jgi:hypothetical protein
MRVWKSVFTFDVTEAESRRVRTAKRSGVPDAARFAEGSLGFTPDAPQRELLLSKAKRGILNCTRQWGKSTVAAVKAVHRAHFYAGSLVIVASPTERQSAEFLLKARQFMKRLRIPVRGDGHHRASLRFPNGSRIVGLPGKGDTLRGYSEVSLMIIDEAARVTDEMYKTLRPMLAVAGGDLWLLSTPNGKRGFFHENWANGGDLWERITVTAVECPRIPESFLEEERRELGSQWFRQEYMCEFGDDDTRMFPGALVRAALDDVEPMEFKRRR